MYRKLFRAVIHRWPLKLFSLVLAYGIWLSVTSESVIVNHFTVPLEITLPETAASTRAVPTQVSVRLRGRSTEIRRIDPLKLRVGIDLSDANVGERSIQFVPSDLVGLPAGAVVERFDPARITLVLDEKMRRVLPVIPALEGKPAEGFDLYRVKASPASVEVEGPKSQISRLTGLVTGSISLKDHSEPFQVQTSTIPDSPSVRILGNQKISVQITIDRAGEEKTFKNIPVVGENLEWKASFSPAAVEVTLSAPPSVLAKIDQERIRAVADLSGLAPGEKKDHLEIRLEYPGLSQRDLSRILVKKQSRKAVAATVAGERM